MTDGGDINVAAHTARHAQRSKSGGISV